MRTINDTVARLKTIRLPRPLTTRVSDRLSDLPEWSGAAGLRARIFIPADLPDDAPLVVVLHGCKQDAASYDHGSGWSQLAERHGFALLFPEQQRANNAGGCFNWFDPQHATRGTGEAGAIAEMVKLTVNRFTLDPARIFVGGLSAGGAMTAVMLATYPELFAGGAIIAGLPFGTAGNVPQAFDRMRGHGGPAGAALPALVRGASGHHGPWPTLSIWHGSADATVSDRNVDAILDQWRPLHGVGTEADLVETVDGCRRRAWRDRLGREVIEDYRIDGLGHGTPLLALGEDGVGAAGPFMLEAGISSTFHIARFWGLTGDGLAPARVVGTAATIPDIVPAARKGSNTGSYVTNVIETSLRNAGLMR